MKFRRWGMKLEIRFRWLVAMIMAASWTGCGAGLVPVEGVVTLDGKPLAAATVTLQRPDGPTSERSYLGETDTEGRYQLKSAHGGSAGARVGNYHVFITSVKIPPDVNELTKLPPDRVPLKWRDGSQMFEVPSSGTSEANFSITSR